MTSALYRMVSILKETGTETDNVKNLTIHSICYSLLSIYFKGLNWKEEGEKEIRRRVSEWLQFRGSHEHDWWKLVTKRDKSLFRDIVGHELFILDFTIYFILFRRTPANVEIIGIIIWGFFKNWKQKISQNYHQHPFQQKYWSHSIWILMAGHCNVFVCWHAS